MELAKKLHQIKYRAKDETFNEMVIRFCDATKDSLEHFEQMRPIVGNQYFLPAGRQQSAVGAVRTVTPFSCFVSGIIEDNTESIMLRLTEAFQTMRVGGGIGYDFSRLRPARAHIVSLDSEASGPLPFIDMFDMCCKAVSSAGHRRGAQMGVLRIDHPDIEDFVRAKSEPERWTQFNVSVGVTDDFMRKMANDEDFDLVFEGRVYKTVRARALWKLILRSTLEHAEPGVLFLDTINRQNNLHYCEVMEATNPCAEQPLPPFGACLLGSFNLAKYMVRDLGGFRFDTDLFLSHIPPVVRAIDNIIDGAHFPLPEQKEEALNKRRMGLGVTGMANAIEAMGLPYGSEHYIKMQNKIMEVMRDAVYGASVRLAEEKGAFPLFDDKYLDSGFARTLPDSIRNSIRLHGIRNSHLLSIAPTGTISLCADNVSSGIEPVFTHRVERDVKFPDGEESFVIDDYAYREWGIEGKTAHEVSVAEHVAVVSAAYRFVDSAVSKTVNCPNDITWDEFRLIYWTAWKNGCKGLATYTDGKSRDNMMRAAVEEDSDGAACFYDPETGTKSCD